MPIQPAPNRAPRVLLIDDDPAIRFVLSEWLTDDGYTVQMAESGDAGLAVLEGWRPDVIVLDLMMPVMDGWTFRAEQRRLQRASDVPLVVLSASRSAAGSAKELGAAVVLTKPFDLPAVQAAIEGALACLPAK